ncbi:hypothetical protein [Undibacter mobilis]|uniref:Uncharacterized protein n=1 Tax=Undibacter mobilis TaxID=2292256 RepID=A0A371B0S3_9BRAD|nr:hypothetical protein [Undibacter mobilis]RDV01179.1 hypothetical protein DXH78_18270 [Undibacter mobilis]
MNKIAGITLLALSALLSSGTANAQPMKCSGEEKTCQQACAKVPTAMKSACLTECGVRRNVCMRTGCWDNGQLRYCGLAKQ